MEKKCGDLRGNHVKSKKDIGFHSRMRDAGPNQKTGLSFENHLPAPTERKTSLFDLICTIHAPKVKTSPSNEF